MNILFSRRNFVWLPADHLRYVTFPKGNDLFRAEAGDYRKVPSKHLNVIPYRNQDILTGLRYSSPMLEPIYRSHRKGELFPHCVFYGAPLPTSDISRAMLFSLIGLSHKDFFAFRQCRRCAID